MSAEMQFLEEWIPERMDPGTVFVLENQSKMGQEGNPFVAVMSCPRCGTMGLITRRQLFAGDSMICGGDVCSAEYKLDGENICYGKPRLSPQLAQPPSYSSQSSLPTLTHPIIQQKTRRPKGRRVSYFLPIA